ncbi:hypothetical protein K501DRAFT_332457 [Backusella circina FSU 941]|nr:hypothetical protein K501DRAFT_332457 [Backusella circina FSU 941]
MISANEAKKQLDEIDQLITMQLQGIDKNFAACCEFLNKILADVEEYNKHTDTILEAFEVWEHFFSLFEQPEADMDPSIADTTSITNRPPIHDQMHDLSSSSRPTPWNRRKRSLESTPEYRLGLRRKGFAPTFVSDSSSSTNLTDNQFYSPPQTIPFGVSRRRIAGTPVMEQAKMINDSNMQAMSVGLMDSDPSDDMDSPKLKSPPRNNRRVYHDPKIFSSSERIADVMKQPSSNLMGLASPANRSTRYASVFKKPLNYKSNNNNNNIETSSSNQLEKSNRSNNSDNLWNDNILDKEVPEERERFNQFLLERQTQSVELNNELPDYNNNNNRSYLSSPTTPNNSREHIPQPMVGSPTVLRVFDKERVDLRRLIKGKNREHTQEALIERTLEENSEKGNNEPMMPTRETPERSTSTREAFESPPILRDDTPMRMTQELDRFSPMRIDDMEDIQHTPEAVPLFAQNLTYRPSPREETSETSNDTTSSNITMIRGETGANIPARFNLKYFPDTFRTPPASTQLTRVFNLFSERPGQMLTLDDVLNLLNDSSFKEDHVILLIDLLKRKKFLKPVGDGRAWTIRR